VNLNRRFTHYKPLYAIENPLEKQVSNGDTGQGSFLNASGSSLCLGCAIC
jgi:hypothetical protein